jgi:hypothetical protein
MDRVIVADLALKTASIPQRPKSLSDSGAARRSRRSRVQAFVSTTSGTARLSSWNETLFAAGSTGTALPSGAASS